MWPISLARKTTKLDPLWYLETFANSALLDVVRLHLPELIGRQIIEVQPMSAEAGSIYNMKFSWNELPWWKRLYYYYANKRSV
jgi:hypothetical protein